MNTTACPNCLPPFPTHKHTYTICRDVGTMDTHHHKVTVRVKSVLDSCGDDEGGAVDQAMEEMMASQQVGVA